MEGKYTFKEFYENLENGYQIYYTYVRNRYLIFKTAEKAKKKNGVFESPIALNIADK